MAGVRKLVTGSGGRVQKTVRLGLAVAALLQNDEVRRALRGASSSLRTWAQKRRTQLDERAHDRRGPLTRVTDTFGQGALERRVDSLVAVIPEIEPVDTTLAAELRATESDLRRAVTVAGRMPLAKRWRAQRGISSRLDEIERSLIDAVLSPR
jgi:hypothetical protein